MINDTSLLRSSTILRETNETKIVIKINLDGTGKNSINTGIGFFDHMLEQLSKHSLIDINLTCDGDLHIDAHHSIEDIGWALGSAFDKALGERRGIYRYSSNYLPMDECLTRCSLDVSGRPWLVWNVFLPSTAIKGIETEIFREFFQAFSQAAKITIHFENLYGTNTHHIIESCFKALALSIRKSIEIDLKNKSNIPSTKGTITGNS